VAKEQQQTASKIKKFNIDSRDNSVGANSGGKASNNNEFWSSSKKKEASVPKENNLDLNDII